MWKVCTLPDKNHRIPSGYNRFDQNRIIPLRRESSKNTNLMLGNIESEISICKGSLSVDKNIILNYPSNPAISRPVSLSTEITNRQFKSLQFLRTANSIVWCIIVNSIVWWVHNLKLNNGRSLTWKRPQLTMKSDASKEGRGA